MNDDCRSVAELPPKIKRQYTAAQKARQKEICRRWREANKEKEKIRRKRYYADNCERIKEIAKAKRVRAVARGWKRSCPTESQVKRRKETAAAYYLRNKTVIQEKNVARKDKLKQYSRNHYLKNKADKNAKNILWKINNKERAYKIEKERRRRNRDSILAGLKIKRSADLQFAIRGRLRCRMYGAFARAKVKKNTSTIQLLGCSPDFLIKHFERQFTKGMNWKNMGRGGWHIDHIVPCASFDLTLPEQQMACFHFSNLRPAWERDNLSKSDKIITCQPELPLALSTN